MPNRRRQGAAAPRLYAVEVLATTEHDDTNLIRDWPSFCLDQRAFGPRRLLVAFCDRSARLRYLTVAPRPDDLTFGLRCAIDTVTRYDEGRRGLAAAVVFNDEAVSTDIPADVGARFEAASLVCAEHGLRLVDWFMCDDDRYRSMLFSIDPDAGWWPWPTDEAA